MILSWDVGIKNMAYCLMDYQNDQYIIEDWGILNLYDDVPTPREYTCQKLKKDGNKCEKKAKFIENGHYYCSIHSKNGDSINNTFKCSSENCSKKVMFYHSDNKKLYCTKCSKNINKLKIVKLKGNKNIQQLSTILYNKLDKLPNLLNVTEVLIENQPVFKNPTMKSIQMILYSYFVLRGIIDDKKNINMSLMSAKNKLKVYDGPKITKFDHIKSKYSRDKKLSIEYCNIFLEKCKDSKKWKEYFINYKKNRGKGIIGNDDLADTFLMNCYFIKNNII